jgi:hypothetical protein
MVANLCPVTKQPCPWGARCNRRAGFEPWCEREAQEVNAPLEPEEDMAPSDEVEP